MRVVEGILKMTGFGSKSSISFGFEFSWKIGKMSLVVHTARFFLFLSDSSLRKILFFPFFLTIRSIVIEDWKSVIFTTIYQDALVNFSKLCCVSEFI